MPYDPIAVGFITQGRGVTIHRKAIAPICSIWKISSRTLHRGRRGDETESAYAVDIQIEAYDRPGLLRDITLSARQ
ncbi:MAG: hypothetical protein U1F68_20425 [Gammaproteobacteria bacterium]